MAYETGTATDYLDLLEKLRTFLTTNASLVAAGDNWTELKYVGGANREVYLRGPGAAGGDQIFVNIATAEIPASSVYQWAIYGATGFNTAQPVNLQPGVCTEPKYLALWNGSMKYWFIANGRCFKVIAKVSTTYHAAYAGFGIPYATPSEYPYPLVIGGSVSLSTQAYSVATDAARNFWSPGVQSVNADGSTLSMRLVDGVWPKFANKAVSLTPSYFTAPYRSLLIDTDKRLRGSLDGSYSLVPIVMYTKTAGAKNCYCELDGVYYVSGFGNGSENIINIGGVDYLVVQNVYRTGEDDYAAFKLEA